MQSSFFLPSIQNDPHSPSTQEPHLQDNQKAPFLSTSLHSTNTHQNLPIDTYK